MPKTTRIAVMALAAIAAAAFVATMTAAPAQNAYATTTSQLTIKSQLSNGTVLTGYSVEVVSSSTPSTTQTGFTPVRFTLNKGETYSVGVLDLPGIVFDHWLDTDSTDRWRDVTMTRNLRLTAVYHNLAVDVPAPDVTAISEEEVNASSNGLSRLQLNAMVEKISIFGGSDGLSIPDLNLSGYKLQSGSQIMEYNSMYQLICSGLGLLDTMEAVHAAGIDWDGLTEAQQCYLVIVLNADIQLDENGLPL